MTALEHRQSADAIYLLEKSSSNWENIQWFAVSANEWNDHESLEDAQESVDKGRIMRIKPALKSRPWSKPDDVPGPVCWVRFLNGSQQLVTYIGEGLIVFGGSKMLWNQAEGYEYSTDRKTWHKCEVIE